MTPLKTKSLSKKNKFIECVEFIDKQYAELNYKLGWRFLYTPKKSFSKKTKLFFIGLNPAGKVYQSPCPSVENGNAYRVENWNDYGMGNSILQIEVQKFFKLLAQNNNPKESWIKLMDKTLTSNYCPFRSPSWAKLKNKTKVIKVSNELWSKIIEHITPAVIVSMDWISFKNISCLLSEKGFKSTKSIKTLTGWGKTTYSEVHFSASSKKILLIRLPHLSRFKIFTSSKCSAESNKLIQTISQYINSPQHI